MPLTPLPDEGIELPLSEYTRLRAFQGGGWFWDHENQQVIRAELGGFLPRVEERPRGSAGGAVALFQHFLNNTEVAGKSEAIGASMNRVPRAEYQRLQRALEALKRKSEDPHTDPTARRLIEKFCLPDPAQNPDLYRLHGSAWNRRLLVLWGCEKEQGTSLAPVAALHKLSVEPPAASFLRRLPLLLGLLLFLILLALLAYRFWPRHDEQPRKNPPAAVADSSPTPPTAQIAATPSNPALPGNDATATATVPATSGQRAPMAGGGSPGSTVPPLVSQDNSPNPSLPTSKLAGNDTTSAHHSDSTASGQSAPTAPAARSPDPTAPSSSTFPGAPLPSPTVSRASIVVAPPAPIPAPSPTGSRLLDEASHQISLSTPIPAPRIFKTGDSPFRIIQEGDPGPPRDGKMDVVLFAHAPEDGMHTLVVTVAQWTVDGVPYQDRPGHNATGVRLPLTLLPGIHQISVVGTAAGRPVEAQAEVNVQIKSQGDVTVKSGPKE